MLSRTHHSKYDEAASPYQDVWRLRRCIAVGRVPTVSAVSIHVGVQRVSAVEGKVNIYSS